MALEEIFGGVDDLPLPPITNRTVAILDVLGFKALLRDRDLPSLARRYATALEGVTRFLAAGDDLTEPEEFRRAIVCDRFIFSDTIILVSTSDDAVSADDVLMCAWRMCQFFIVAGLPLRGAVAYGEMHADREKQVFLGKALVAAHQLESRQEWIGVAIDESVVAKFPRLFPDRPQDRKTAIVPHYHVPMKDGTTELLRTLNWRAQFAAERGIRRMFPKTGELSADRKIDNALAYAAEMRARGFDLQMPCVHRTAPLFITDNPGERQISHGDEL